MRIKDANTLREDLAQFPVCKGGRSGAVSSIFISIINAIDKMPEIEVVPLEEYKALERRFRHLMQSEYIASFDAVDHSGKYKRDISEAGKFPASVQRERWLHVGRTAGRNFFRCSGCACVVFSKDDNPDFPQCPECFAMMDGGGKND